MSQWSLHAFYKSSASLPMPAQWSTHTMDWMRAPIPPVKLCCPTSLPGSRGGTCHLTQGMHRNHARHLCYDRPTPPEMAGQPRCCSSRRLCWDCRSSAEVIAALQRNTSRRRTAYSMRRFLASCGSRACLSLDEGSLGRAAAVLWLMGYL